MTVRTRAALIPTDVAVSAALDILVAEWAKAPWPVNDRRRNIDGNRRPDWTPDPADPRTPALLQRRIYNWARDGKLTRHGQNRRGSALWNLWEIETRTRSWIRLIRATI